MFEMARWHRYEMRAGRMCREARVRGVCVFAYKNYDTLSKTLRFRGPHCSMTSTAASTEHESGGVHSSSLPSPWFSSVSRP